MMWQVIRIDAGYRLRLVGRNGEEIVRAMTIYNDKRDAVAAIEAARASSGAYEELDDREPICTECGGDLAAEGQTKCTDCLEETEPYGVKPTPGPNLLTLHLSDEQADALRRGESITIGGADTITVAGA